MAADLTKSDLCSLVQERCDWSREEAYAFVEAFFGAIAAALEQGEAVKLSGFGVFLVRDKRERPGRNPRTGEPAAVTPRRVVLFHASPKLRAQVLSSSVTSSCVVE